MKERLQKNIATKMPGLASKGICLKKHDDAIKYLIEGIALWMKNLEEEFGPEIREVVKNTQFELGRNMAKQMKEKYKIGDDITDAVDMMWMFIIPFGIKMKVSKINDGRIREEKTICPIYDVFNACGVDYCEEFCVSMTRGWLAAINSDLNCEMIRKANKDQYCIKDIINVKDQGKT